MASSRVAEILEEAFGDPASAFVRLWVGLRGEPGWLPYAIDEWRSSASDHQDVGEAISKALRSRSPALLPRTCTDDHAIAVLMALDAFLADEYAGDETAPPEAVPCDGKRYWLRSRPSGWSMGFRRQPTHLQGYARHHWVVADRIDRFRVELAAVPDYVCAALSGCRTADEIVVCVGGFDDGVLPDWIDTADGRRTADVLSDPVLRGKCAVEWLGFASTHGAKIVVFPELAITKRVRHEIQAWLRDTRDHGIALVVAGSFHEQEGDRRHNVARTLDGRGDVVHVHRKLQWAGDVEPDMTGGVVEGINAHHVVAAFTTPLGAVVTPICLDFCQAAHPLHTVWSMVGAEIALVPSMSNLKTLHAHVRRAVDLRGEHGTITAVAIQPHPEPPPRASQEMVAGEGFTPERLAVQAQDKLFVRYGLAFDGSVRSGGEVCRDCGPSLRWAACCFVLRLPRVPDNEV